ncbi:MAG: hypothetical protein KDE48_01335 [Anaerolineales bacterium]|nr:hypothetical protein [Anaerolineales bacterium]
MLATITAVFNWLAERLRDFLMWPINLIRDFPVRSGRLLVTLWRGLRAIVFFTPELVNAQRKQNLHSWSRYKAGRFFDWWHQLLTQLFDLLGGPELGEFLMHLVTNTTPLTPKEIHMIAAVLGENAMRFGDIRVVEGGLFDLVFKLNGNLAFATWHSINLPRKKTHQGSHTRANLPIVVHELTHVYQYEKVGTRYLGEAVYMLIKTKRDCYNYGGIAGLKNACAAGICYRDFNREQQAKITQDYFYYCQHNIDVAAFEPFIAQVRAGEL